MSYAPVFCYSCGDPGHHVDKCERPKACFICKMINHKVEACPIRKKPHTSARYVGSVAPGLGFYHLDTPDANAQHQGALTNVGIVLVEQGEVSKEELSKEFVDIYKTNWPWPINALDEWSFLVKFPPEIDVVQVAGYPCFGLKKENVIVNVEVWKGNVEPEEDLQDTWIKIRKMNPKLCNWMILDQITSILGVLLDVDWHHNFKSFYETFRVKISCKDPSKIPNERLFGIQESIYKLLIEVEPPGNDDARTGSSTNPALDTTMSLTSGSRENTAGENRSQMSSRSDLSLALEPILTDPKTLMLKTWTWTPLQSPCSNLISLPLNTLKGTGL